MVQVVLVGGAVGEDGEGRVSSRRGGPQGVAETLQHAVERTHAERTVRVGEHPGGMHPHAGHRYEAHGHLYVVFYNQVLPAVAATGRDYVEPRLPSRHFPEAGW